MNKYKNTSHIVLNETIPFLALLVCVGGLFFNVSVFAFGGGGGGGGHGLTSTMYKGGADAIGVHINGKSDGPIETTCPDRSEWDMEKLACVCEEGWVLDKDACVLDQCVDVKDDVCIASCDPLTGATTFTSYGLPCGENQVCNGYGMCVCDTPYEIWNGTCVLKCESGYGRDSDGVCQPCPETVAEVTTESLCDACFAGSFWNNDTCYAACTKTNYFHNKNGNCRTSCIDDTRVETTEKECYQACGNQRKVIHYNNRTYCAALVCQEEDGVPQFQDHIGTCYSCKTVVPQPVKEAKDCTDACGDLRAVYEYHEDDRHRINCAIASCEPGLYHTNKGACASCSSENANPTTADECHLCNAGEKIRFMSTDGICYKCTDRSAIVTTMEECNECDGLRYYSEGACRVCPSDLARLTDEAQCMSCGGQMINDVCTRSCEGTVYCADKDGDENCVLEACCREGGSVATNIGINNADVCCGYHEGGYCSERDANGACIATDCCYNSAVIHNIKIGDVCADCYAGLDIYCVSRDAYGDCTQAACCTGELHRNMGLNEADVCCMGEQVFSCAENDAHEDCVLGLCCEMTETAYCSDRDENGKCVALACCAGPVDRQTGPHQADICSAQ